MGKKNIFDKYITIEELPLNMFLEDKEVVYHIKLIIINPKRKELSKDFYNHVVSYLDGEQLIGINIYLMTMFYLKYKNPITDPQKPVITYKRDKRKFDIRTLEQNQYLTFSENKKLSQTYNLKAKIKRLYKSIELNDKRKLSAELINDTLYYNTEFLTSKDSKEYLDFSEKIISEFIDLEFPEKEISPEEKYELFKRSFYDYEKKEETKEFITKFLYECEGVYDYVWEEFFKEVFQTLSTGNLFSENDKKIFEFIYLRNEYFDYHIPIFEHVLVEFWNQMELGWRKWAIWSLIEEGYKEDRSKIISFLKSELEKFLKLYKVWLSIIQQDEELDYYDRQLLLKPDVNNKERIPLQKSKTKGHLSDDEKEDMRILSLNQPVGDSELGLELIDIIPAPPSSNAKIKELAEIMEEVLTEKQKEVMEAYYFNGVTQSNLAEYLGISQAAVNQRLVSAVNILRETLKKS